MANFAIIENNIVTNVVVADSLEDAQSANPDKILFDADSLGIAVGSFKENNIWYPAKPFNSWIWNEEDLRWIAPVSPPEDDKAYYWNEDIVNWSELVI